jgi:type IV secretory pathway TrbD component
MELGRDKTVARLIFRLKTTLTLQSMEIIISLISRNWLDYSFGKGVYKIAHSAAKKLAKTAAN